MDKGQHVNIQIKSTEEFLQQRGITMDDVISETKFLMEATGHVFKTLLQLSKHQTELTIDNEIISKILNFSSVFRGINQLPGFNKHLLEYTKNNIEDHFFSARTANWLFNNGFDVEFEPGSETQAKHPDLLIKLKDLQIAIECKNPNISDFYQRDLKRKIADFVFDRIKTLHQFNFYFYEDPDFEEFKSLFTDDFVAHLLELGELRHETRFPVSELLEIGVIPMRDHIVPEEYQLVAEMAGISVNINTGIRMPAFSFMQEARSIQVHGPVRNFNKHWNRFRSKSKKQGVEGLPLVTVINGDHVLGDPNSHLQYFENEWLTDKNSAVSGIGLLHFATLDGFIKFDYYPNLAADQPLSSFPMKN